MDRSSRSIIATDFARISGGSTPNGGTACKCHQRIQKPQPAPYFFLACKRGVDGDHAHRAGDFKVRRGRVKPCFVCKHAAVDYLQAVYFPRQNIRPLITPSAPRNLWGSALRRAQNQRCRACRKVPWTCPTRGGSLQGLCAHPRAPSPPAHRYKRGQ